VHITDNLKKSLLSGSMLKLVEKPFFNLWKLKKCGLVPKTLTNF
jgi:hypothetical protein